MLGQIDSFGRVKFLSCERLPLPSTFGTGKETKTGKSQIDRRGAHMAELNISQAAKRWGKSRQTVYSYLEQGKLSAKQDNEGSTVIDSAEMLRVFGEPSKKTTSTRVSKDTQSEANELRHLIEIERLKRSHSEETQERLSGELRELKAVVRQLREQDERRDKQMQTALENINKALDKQALPEPKRPLLEQITGLWKKS